MDRFTALADPTRRAMLEMLSKRGERAAGGIAARFAMSGAPACWAGASNGLSSSRM